MQLNALKDHLHQFPIIVLHQNDNSLRIFAWVLIFSLLRY
ncbi:hypothetical protein HMPREF0539_2862 [Lacticaseibacillus rhamnosus LMS2-1]|uniref:Uncharacterized protein n=1 Tax=Lacticaseibacillus rhamnosus (strain LMS2-1) TaxID=525361 RepID=C2K127_LACRM|nr:conserved hypothetical protein [Lacticaseibacillus rhamnosus ATCC 8530]EEN78998.1 hypothetical protein HMPREF0539_2862 [Lacticaseibacillus rhamnosus LMS2-1]